MVKSDYLTVGKVVGAHGIAGAVKVHSYADSLDFFKSGESIQFVDKRGWTSVLRINWGKPHGKALLILFEGIDDRTKALELIGSELKIRRSLLPKLENGTYYWSDLIGMQVLTGNDECLGQIDSIIQTGSNDVYVVRNIGKERDQELLIPAIESVITSVDIEQGILRVTLPEGL
ncbi:MAG: ribosome maturation factor RimM [Thermodesulfobacteriota bacterium]